MKRNNTFNIQIYKVDAIVNGPIYDLLYLQWKEVWQQAYVSDFSIKEKLNSDYYKSQDYILAVFEGSKCIASITLKKFNLKRACDLDDSYFNIWPAEVIANLLRLGNTYLSCGNLAVSSDYRGRIVDDTFSLKEVLFAAVRESLKIIPCDGIISNTRNKKSVNLAAYRTGAIPLLRNIDYSIQGQPVDLLMWHKDYLGPYESPFLQALIQNQFHTKNIHNEFILRPKGGYDEYSTRERITRPKIRRINEDLRRKFASI